MSAYGRMYAAAVYGLPVSMLFNTEPGAFERMVEESSKHRRLGSQGEQHPLTSVALSPVLFEKSNRFEVDNQKGLIMKKQQSTLVRIEVNLKPRFVKRGTVVVSLYDAKSNVFLAQMHVDGARVGIDPFKNGKGARLSLPYSKADQLLNWNGDHKLVGNVPMDRLSTIGISTVQRIGKRIEAGFRAALEALAPVVVQPMLPTFENGAFIAY